MTKTNYNATMANAYHRYKMSDTTELWQAYEKPSYNKQNAFNYCKKLQADNNGYNLRIIGFNCHNFSVGFMFEKDGKKHFAYITKTYDRYCEV